MRKSSKVIFVFGCLLIVTGLVLILTLKFQAKQAEQMNDQIVQNMENILCDHREGMQESECETEMPVLELDGVDFAALLEIPLYDLKLPVCNVWNKNSIMSYPCRFDGTIYNGTLIIGGYDQSGQFEFFDYISEGTEVLVTDMTGAVFSYKVSRVERSKSADIDVLKNEGTDLTMFVRDAQLLEYIIVRCTLK